MYFTTVFPLANIIPARRMHNSLFLYPIYCLTSRTRERERGRDERGLPSSPLSLLFSLFFSRPRLFAFSTHNQSGDGDDDAAINGDGEGENWISCCRDSKNGAAAMAEKPGSVLASFFSFCGKRGAGEWEKNPSRLQQVKGNNRECAAWPVIISISLPASFDCLSLIHTQHTHSPGGWKLFNRLL